MAVAFLALASIGGRVVAEGGVGAWSVLLWLVVLGFGAGMGLPNIKKCADVFEINSEMGHGTHIHAEVMLEKARMAA